ncbi:MAG: flagellar basal-body rod protein FlgF [Alphaproteobacteria bacterium]
MENGIYIGISRQAALRRQMDVVANNLANVNTPAYRAERMVFNEFLMKPSQDKTGYSYVQDVGQYRSTENGPITQTGNDLDIALNGDGYFVVDTPLGERYTRHGRFQLDAEGFVVNTEGHRLLTNAGPIQIPPQTTSIEINGDGSVSTEAGPLGTLQVVTFEGDQELRRGANGIYTTEQDPQQAENVQIVQGSLEQSNVVAVLEMTRMIEISNAHNSLRKVLQNEDERQRTMIRRLGSSQG